MVEIRPFNGYRPKEELADKVAAKPYDVLNSKEARDAVEGNPISFLRVTKPEVNLEKDVDVYSETVYVEGRIQLNKLIVEHVLIQDKQPCLYIYAQTMNGKRQIGIVAGSSIDDYFNGLIKKHEFTRPKKENDRIAHMKTVGAHLGPVFLTYKKVEEIDTIVNKHIENTPTYSFTADDDVKHEFWIVDNSSTIAQLTNLFKEKVAATYIADGHHRAAASAKVGAAIRTEQGEYDKDAPFNYFLSVLFPDEQLNIIDYNRLVTDLNDLTEEQFLEKIATNFDIDERGGSQFKPHELHHFGMYMNKKWYRLIAKAHTYDANDPIKVLDVSALSDYLIAPVLGITDQRTDERIDFVGGIRGLGELEKRVDSGEMAVAFALYPVTIQQLIDIADSGNVMPPKSTWFEPKLRSGLIINKF